MARDPKGIWLFLNIPEYLRIWIKWNELNCWVSRWLNFMQGLGTDIYEASGPCNKLLLKSICWYHQLGPVYTVKWTVYALKAKVDWFVYIRCVFRFRFEVPLNPISRNRSLAQGYIHRNVIYQTLACSDRGICPENTYLFFISLQYAQKLKHRSKVVNLQELDI